MQPVYSVAAMRKSDAAAIVAGIPARELMRRAGEGIFSAYPWKGPVAVVCGPGNNGGDGFVLALCFARAGILCRILLLSDSFSEDGAFYFAKCREAGIPVETEIAKPDFSGDCEIADCLFGTGFHGGLTETAKQWIEAINQSGKPVISADLNSGLHGDSGMGEPAVKSTLTVSVGFPKAGHYLGRAKDLIGRLINLDIGIPLSESPYRLCEAGDFATVLRFRPQCSQKGDYGYVGILGGCEAYAGAVKLANLSCAALRAGCGVAALMVPESLAPAVAPYLLESTLETIPDRNGAMLFDPGRLREITARRRALAIGMGWGNAPANREILTWILKEYPGFLVIDADAINCLSQMDRGLLRRVSGRAILTPHPKEMERLCGIPVPELLEDPVAHAMEFAAQYGVTLLLKGPTTVVTDGKETYLVNRGCAGMATAGSGDVLSGVLAGMLGYSDATPLTAACGAYLAGLAGELAEAEENPISMTSSDTIRMIPAAMSRMLEAQEHISPERYDSGHNIYNIY